MVMEPKYYAEEVIFFAGASDGLPTFAGGRWLDTQIIIWEHDWIPGMIVDLHILGANRLELLDSKIYGVWQIYR